MSVPPAPGPRPGLPHPATPPTPDRSGRRAAGIVLAVLGVFVLGGGVLVLLCGGLGYVMTGGSLDTGAGAMLLVGLLVMVLGVGMLAAALLALRRR